MKLSKAQRVEVDTILNELPDRSRADCERFLNRFSRASNDFERSKQFVEAVVVTLTEAYTKELAGIYPPIRAEVRRELIDHMRRRIRRYFVQSPQPPWFERKAVAEFFGEER